MKDLKIWAVGYSRAGAIADLLGVYFNQHLSEFDTSTDDLYIYTFETPAASKEDVVYDNIYVVRNINDLIPFVYPEGWGLNTNGKIIEIGENQTIMTYTGLIEQEEYEEKQLNEFYHDLFDWLSGRISRETYSQYLEGPLSSLLDIYFSKSAEDREALLNFFMEDVKSQLLENEDNKNKLISKAWAVMGHNSDFLYQSISNDIISIMDGIRDSENGSTITDEEYEMIRSSVFPLLRALGPLVIDDSNYYAGIDYEHYYTYDAEDFNLTDEQMGEKHGKESGFFNGYDDAVNGYAYDETPDEDESEYGPDYLKAYQESYVPAYKEGNVLGIEHRKDPVAKGKYDAGKYAYESGYYSGNHHEEYSPNGDDYYQEDWMSDDYFEVYKQAYTDEYIRLYELGYENGKNDPEKEEMITPESLSMYHLAS